MFTSTVTDTLGTPFGNNWSLTLKRLLLALTLVLSMAAILPSTPAGRVSAQDVEALSSCYASTIVADIGYASGYAYGEGEGVCNAADEHHTLQVCVRVNVVDGSDYDASCSSDAGYSTYYYANVSDYACGQIWIQSRIDGRISDSGRVNSC